MLEGGTENTRASFFPHTSVHTRCSSGSFHLHITICHLSHLSNGIPSTRLFNSTTDVFGEVTYH